VDHAVADGENIYFAEGHYQPGTRVGEPQATTCRQYDTRYDGMPIPMQYLNGTDYGWAKCAKDSSMEDLVIRFRGIGRGCSLELAHG